MDRARVLVVGLERAIFTKIEPILSRSDLAADRVPSGESGLLLAGKATFELFVLRHPLPDMALGSFINQAHEPGARNGGTPILVLTDDDRLVEMRRLLAEGGKEVLSVREPAKLLQKVASRLLKVAPRIDTRILVRVETKAAADKTLLNCQSENLSENGLLLRSDTLFPMGTRLRVEFTLPGERMSVSGEAEVVRHAVPEVENVKGMGLRFVFLKGDGQRRVREFLGRKPA